MEKWDKKLIFLEKFIVMCLMINFFPQKVILEKLRFLTRDGIVGRLRKKDER